MRKTVLLVEDEAKLAHVLAEQLEEEGFDVRQAHSLRHALRLLDDLVPDVAVIDIGLPDGTGLDVLRRLRCGADRLDSGTPVLVLTARTEEADVLRGFERGADDYLRKPFDRDATVVRVRDAIAAWSCREQITNALTIQPGETDEWYRLSQSERDTLALMRLMNVVCK